jgi:hypothetical protein
MKRREFWRRLRSFKKPVRRVWMTSKVQMLIDRYRRVEFIVENIANIIDQGQP